MHKCVGGRGSAPDPTGGAHDPLVGWGGGHPSPEPTPRRLWRLDPRACCARLSTQAVPLLKRSGAHGICGLGLGIIFLVFKLFVIFDHTCSSVRSAH